MKKIISVLLIFILFLCSCRNIERQEKAPDSKISGVWVTYSEVDNLLKNGKLKQNFDLLLENIKSNKITDVFLQVHPFCNSLFHSEFFPQNELAKKYNYDVFSYMLKAFHSNNIKVHAWLNPYRVMTESTDISALDKGSPAYKWLNDQEDGNDLNVCIYNGIYLNPSSSEVKKLITDAVREILTGYDVDGIHIDDYFYPTSSADFDKSSYDEYKKNTENPLSLSEFRTSHISSLISSLYTTVKFEDKDILLSISPSASIEKNKTQYYADIKSWTDNECVDMIIPQLYFGFDYPDENYRFDKLLEDYKNLPLKSTKLVIGLATYKIGTDNLPDKYEWKNGKDIIKKQISICENDKKIDGYVFFSYSSFLKYKNKAP
ncbi:MAG: family 10 glycosylhydrolase [Clostridia bacterium]|nr:family 10 glycosylhydrolase [Clostridia bacterium]